MQSKVQRGGGAITGAVTREDVRDMVISSEESSSYPDELELGLGLGVGGGKVRIKPPASAAAGGGGRDRATANNYPAKSVSSSSSSSSSVTVANTNNGSCGSKRAAESPSSPPPRSAISQVVGWPPVRTYRMNTLTNQSKSPEEFFSTVDKSQTKITVTNHGGNSKEKGLQKTFLFVKVNMDRVPIGRKVDLNAHSCYEDLARALDHMFRTNRLNEAEQSLQLLGGSSEFVLTYEDKEGDWMLVGDVPWVMFLNTVRRLRIMRTAEANGLAHSLLE